MTEPRPDGRTVLAALDAELDAHLLRDPEAVREEFNRKFRNAWEARA